VKVLTIFGTRPEIIRLSQVIRQLDRLCDHVLVHTGQNYDPALSDVFFNEMAIRFPDVHLGIQASGFAQQAALILERSAEVLQAQRPDRLLVLGDTNSGLSAIVAARMGIPVFHMEAGNRCYDDRVPEELNRRIIDHCSTVLMPYTHRSKENLLREGIERQRIYVIGNPIYEVLNAHTAPVDASSILKHLDVQPSNYFLATLHRAENVDFPDRLKRLVAGLSAVAEEFGQPIVVSVHPRTTDQMRRHGVSPQSDRVRLVPPLGFFDFVKLERNARCVLSDSGTVQEECCILRVPNVTIRDVTERPETIECGSNVLTGDERDSILTAVRVALTTPPEWLPPAEYVTSNVSATVARIVLGYCGAPHSSRVVVTSLGAFQ
jgi:UDP-N-acetylglucosamine 2-epimerase (non-hydrolysing)